MEGYLKPNGYTCVKTGADRTYCLIRYLEYEAYEAAERHKRTVHMDTEPLQKEFVSSFNDKNHSESEAEWIECFPNRPTAYLRRCSKCGNTANMIRCKYKFCPNCGRLMKEGGK